MIVLLVCLEMFREVRDPRGQNRYLDFGRADVSFADCEFADQLGFFAGTYRHRFLLCVGARAGMSSSMRRLLFCGQSTDAERI